MTSTELEYRIKEIIVDALQLVDVQPETIPTDAPLFGAGLGLDSIDALELASALERNFMVTFSETDPEMRDAFRSVAGLAAFVAKQRVDVPKGAQGPLP
ncbi:MAG: acyl carrier protein [Myxococcales bacterium]|nr:acyl carrier protein [Myxococcales bacterium]